MTQAFSDRLKERGGIRTWVLIAGDLSISVPQQLMEVSVMSQKWMAAFAAVGSVLILASTAMGLGPPILFLGVGICIFALFGLWSAKRNDRPAEFSYGGTAPKAWKWWTVLAALLAVTYVVAAAGQLIADPKATNVGALGIMTGFATLIAGGLKLRSKSRIAGNWMIVVAAVPALAFFWIIVPAAVALAIIFGAVTEISRAKPQTPIAA